MKNTYPPSLTRELIPVLLGYSHEAVNRAHAFYRKYHVVSHVFCHKTPFPHVSLCMKYHVVRHTTDEELMLCALLDFSEQLGNADVIPYLIPCSEDYERLIWAHKTELEPHFIIAELCKKGGRE